MGVEHKPTQNERILEYIEEFGSITQLEALRDIGCMRLASRISDLKRLGYSIVSEIETVENRFGEKCHIKRYRMEGAVMNRVLVDYNTQKWCEENPDSQTTMIRCKKCGFYYKPSLGHTCITHKCITRKEEVKKDG